MISHPILELLNEFMNFIVGFFSLSIRRNSYTEFQRKANLTFYLSCFDFPTGFKKEQIRVQVSSSRVLRISGERQLSDNRWSCFLEEIPLSSNYNQKEISASYDKGILYVKHPKLIVQDDAELQENEQPPVESSTLDGKPPQEKAQQPTKMDKDKAAKGLVSGAQKLNMESYRKDFSGLVVDMTKPRKLLNLVLFILSVVVLGMYARKAISWSFKKSEN